MSRVVLLISFFIYITGTAIALKIKNSNNIDANQSNHSNVQVIPYKLLPIPSAEDLPSPKEVVKKTNTTLEEQYNLPKGILEAVHKVETSGRCRVVSKANARGCFQFNRITQREIYRLFQYKFNPYNYEQSKKAAAMYLAYLAKRVDSLPIRKQDKWLWVLAAYNAGFSNVRRWVKEGKIGFKETHFYIYRVMHLAKKANKKV